MLLSRLTKKLLLPLVLVVGLYANDCERRAFNITITDTVTLNEILVQLSNVCKFSIVAKDVIAGEELQREINGVSIKDLSLRETFNILIRGNNLDYEFKNQTLSISALQTKTFKIDYITGVREGTAILRASTDSSPYEIDDERDAESLEDNRITTLEKFDFWSTLSDEVTAILNNGTERYQAIAPIINQNAGLVTVTGMKSQVDRVEKYVAEMQRRLKRQVMLDVTIVEVQLSNNYTKGIDWSKFEIGFNSYLGNNPLTPSGFTFGNRNPAVMTTNRGTPPQIDSATGRITSYGSDPTFEWGNHMGTKASQSNGVWAIGANLNFNIDGAINFLETKGKSKVISSPKVMTLNNQQAIITVGDVINYVLLESQDYSDDGTPTSQDTTMYSSFIGILLNITPEISDNNKIMLRINPSLSEFKYKEDDVYRTEPRGIAPDTKEKKISTVITVGNGDTVILGGMIGQSKTKNNTRVPILSEIPLVGGLFKSTGDILSTTELVFIITPTIMDNTSDLKLADSLKDLGYSKSIYYHE
ncbi:MAG: pilus (MSHA type) biogenesis protein MshL [Campylobacteraceae bacterium]|nr:pilus (MSHA type) biogenesis protein MshL [Campylobacteraceae bacterium]